MKNDRVGLGVKPGNKQKIVAITLVAMVALFGIVLLARKATDHRVELRQALDSRDSYRLEQLLKDHPKLVSAEIPNRGPKDTWNPLHMAAYWGNQEAIEILLRHKAKVNAKDSNGLTPLHYSVSSGRHQCVTFLINKGADLNAKGRDGRTPLDLAKNLRDKKMIELFRIRGATE